MGVLGRRRDGPKSVRLVTPGFLKARRIREKAGKSKGILVFRKASLSFVEREVCHYSCKKFYWVLWVVVPRQDQTSEAGIMEGIFFEGDENNDFFDGTNDDDTIFGHGGDDALRGLGGKDSLNGGSDNDRLYGDEGDDTLLGGGGNDILAGGDGDDQLEGGDGDDILYAEAGNDDLYGGDGDDTLVLFGGDEFVSPGAGADQIEWTFVTPEVGVDSIFALTISGYDDQDSYFFGDGFRSPLEWNVYFTDEGDKVFEYSERMSTYVNEVLVYYTVTRRITFSDALGDVAAIDVRRTSIAETKFLVVTEITEATDADDTIFGMDVDNEIFAGLGDDIVYAMAGDDLVVGDLGADTLNGNEGRDTVNGGLGNDVINGGSNDDMLSGGLGDDTIYGGYGNDMIFAGDGADYVEGGEGDDTLTNESGEGSRLFSGLGDDALYALVATEMSGEEGSDLLFGSTGNDTLYGGEVFYNYPPTCRAEEDDVLWGGAGDDFLITDAGIDILFGGDGNDTLRAVGQFGFDPVSRTYRRGDDSADYLVGGEGTDRFEIRHSAGVIPLVTDFEPGETIELYFTNQQGTHSIDEIDLGNGVIRITVTLQSQSAYEQIHVDIAGGYTDFNFRLKDSSSPFDPIDRLLITIAEGAMLDNSRIIEDPMIGSAEHEELSGHDAADVIHGREGDDSLYGGNGADTLIGGIGNDLIVGGDGGDLLIGG